MSEAADLNRDPEFERMLRELRRSNWKFRAMNCSSRPVLRPGAKSLAPFVWPAIAAALVIACGGLATYSLRQHSDLMAALATVSDSKAPVAVAAEESTKPQTDAIVFYHALAIERQRDWRWLISSAPMPPGRLTAGGWQGRGRSWEISKCQWATTPSRDRQERDRFKHTAPPGDISGTAPTLSGGLNRATPSRSYLASL